MTIDDVVTCSQISRIIYLVCRTKFGRFEKVIFLRTQRHQIMQVGFFSPARRLSILERPVSQETVTFCEYFWSQFYDRRKIVTYRFEQIIATTNLTISNSISSS